MGGHMSMRSTLDVLAANIAASEPSVGVPVPPTGPRADFSTHPGAWDGFSISLEKQVQQPLNLWLPLRSPAQAPALGRYLIENAHGFHEGVLGLRYVHFARFLIAPDGSNLLVITAFDGDFESYLMDFVATMAPLFTGVMQYVAGAPPLPVERFPAEFMQFIRDHNQSKQGVISAYPPLTVLEILRLAGMRGNNLRHVPRPASTLPRPAATT